eukprot:m.364887 g.364887  ORF g.364887 m.364887 type:complete len:563 (-) comp28930_c0_seq1:281-1969(-)
MSKDKVFGVEVVTPDATLQFEITNKTVGDELFQQVIKTTGLREEWFFDLQYTNSKNLPCWLKRHKKVLSQDVPRVLPIPFELKVKFYPEDVEEEVFQPATLMSFFYHVHKLIVSQELFCTAKDAVHLASLSLQTQFGDYTPETCPKGYFAASEFLPPRIIAQHTISSQQWEDQVTSLYKQHKNLFPDEAAMAYLKQAQDLDMYGISYFEIRNKKGTRLFVGVDAMGLNIYSFNDKLKPKIQFPWREIKSISYHDKKFTIKPHEQSSREFVILAPQVEMNKHMLQLCIGNHELFTRRREPDTMQVQQMRAEATELKERRNADRLRFIRETQARRRAEKSEKKLADKLKRVKEQASKSRQEMLQTKEQAMMLETKVEAAEVAMGQLLEQAQLADDHLQRTLEEKSRTDEEKEMHRMAAEQAQKQVEKLAAIHQQQQEEAAELKRLLAAAREAERQARQELELSRATSAATSVTSEAPDFRDFDMADVIVEEGDDGPQFVRRNTHIADQLKGLSEHLASLQVPSELTEEDLNYQRAQEEGESKFDTLTRISQGTTTHRVAFFEEL